MPSQRDQARINYKRWYEKNKALQVARVRARQEELRVWLEEYKATLACSRCPENDPVCLDFHHCDPSLKEVNIANAIHSGWSKARIEAEIAKCEVLCANCHRKATRRPQCRKGAALAL